MTWRIVGITAALAALAGCTPNYSGEPITESIFYPDPYSSAPTSDTVTTQPLDATNQTADAAAPVQGYDPALAMVEDNPGGSPSVFPGMGGLIERAPDTCNLGGVSYLNGQPASAVQGASITRPYRIVGPSDIVTQEYNPMRVNFYTDDSGRINRIACG